MSDNSILVLPFLCLFPRRHGQHLMKRSDRKITLVRPGQPLTGLQPHADQEEDEEEEEGAGEAVDDGRCGGDGHLDHGCVLMERKSSPSPN